MGKLAFGHFREYPESVYLDPKTHFLCHWRRWRRRLFVMVLIAGISWCYDKNQLMLQMRYITNKVIQACNIRCDIGKVSEIISCEKHNGRSRQ
jgi:hypothetical protein